MNTSRIIYQKKEIVLSSVEKIIYNVLERETKNCSEN